jgi:23S rRNA pseudouridine2604 synthase
LNPDSAHEKEYEVRTKDALGATFKEKMERGVNIGDYFTKPCKVEILGDKKFSIILTEGKKHQIRRMCGFFGQSAVELKRTRVMNIKLGNLRAGEHRKIDGKELDIFLRSLGL